MPVATALHFPSHLHVAHSVHPSSLTKTSRSAFTKRSMLSFSYSCSVSLHADVPIQLVKLSFAPYPTAESSAGQTAQQTALEKHTLLGTVQCNRCSWKICQQGTTKRWIKIYKNKSHSGNYVLELLYLYIL